MSMFKRSVLLGMFLMGLSSCDSSLPILDPSAKNTFSNQPKGESSSAEKNIQNISPEVNMKGIETPSQPSASPSQITNNQTEVNQDKTYQEVSSQENYKLGISYIKTNQNDLAKKYLSQAYEHERDNFNYLFALVCSLLDLHETELALKLLSDFNAKHPNNSNAIMNTGYVYGLLGECDKAETYYKKIGDSISHCPINQEAHSFYRRASFYYDDKQYFQAAQEAEKAVLITPNDILLRLFLANSYQKLFNFSSEIEQYKAIEKIDPKYEGLNQRFSWAYQNLGDCSNAKIYFEKDHKTVPACSGKVLTPIPQQLLKIETLSQNRSFPPKPNKPNTILGIWTVQNYKATNIIYLNCDYRGDENFPNLIQIKSPTNQVYCEQSQGLLQCSTRWKSYSSSIPDAETSYDLESCRKMNEPEPLVPSDENIRKHVNESLRMVNASRACDKGISNASIQGYWKQFGDGPLLAFLDQYAPSTCFQINENGKNFYP